MSELSSDHIADARQYPSGAIFTLPRLPHPPHPLRPSPSSTTTTTTTSSSSAITITLKPLKATHPTVPLPTTTPAKTSIYDLKSHYASTTSLPAAKIKILYKKKPVADSKTVAEVIGADAGSEVEFGVMVMGGATATTAGSSAGSTPVTSPPAVAPSEAEKGLAGETGGPMEGVEVGSGAGPAAQGPSGKEVVAEEAFWDDLKGFLVQRTRDEAEGERLMGLFRGAWEQNK